MLLSENPAGTTFSGTWQVSPGDNRYSHMLIFQLVLQSTDERRYHKNNSQTSEIVFGDVLLQDIYFGTVYTIKAIDGTSKQA